MFTNTLQARTARTARTCGIDRTRIAPGDRYLREYAIRAVGPVHTDGGIREVRALIEGRGYRNRGTVPLFTRVRFCTS